MERLQKYLSECGVASRRKCEEIILNKKVGDEVTIGDFLAYVCANDEPKLREVENKLIEIYKIKVN